jgi:hypothetical protein
MGIVTMALHPTGHDIARDPHGQGLLNVLVHAIAIASVPVVFYGGLALTRLLGQEGVLAEMALIVFGISGVATLMAATASGFLAPGLIGAASSMEGDGKLIAQALLHYNYSVNHAFAKVLVAASSAAMGLWSVEILRTRLLRQGPGVLGCAVAGLALVALASGHLRLDIHGMGAVVLAQAVWFVTVGMELRRLGGGGRAHRG